jgi:hypothetical protein
MLQEEKGSVPFCVFATKERKRNTKEEQYIGSSVWVGVVVADKNRSCLFCGVVVKNQKTQVQYQVKRKKGLSLFAI